jgi:hypothetical protein
MHASIVSSPKLLCATPPGDQILVNSRLCLTHKLPAAIQ